LGAPPPIPPRPPRAAKTRCGATNEIGVFEMENDGLIEVENPSEMLLSGRPADAPGTCVTCVMEGARPVLAEVQALLAPCAGARPMRSSNGFDCNRASMLLAVLEKRGSLKVSQCDAYLNIIGGLTLDEPAADLPTALALYSSLMDMPINEKLVSFGEIGLGGEIRSISNISQRIAEAQRLGFEKCIIPKMSLRQIDPRRYKIGIIAVSNIRQAFDYLKKERGRERPYHPA